MENFEEFLSSGNELSQSPDLPRTSNSLVGSELKDDFSELRTPTAENDLLSSFVIDTPNHGISDHPSKNTSPQKADLNDSFFDDLLMTPTVKEPITVAENEPLASTNPRADSPLEQDFLSWLDDSAPVISNNDPTTSLPNNTSSLGMDDFFEEVFGEKSSDSSLRQNSNQSIGPATPNTFSMTTNLKRFDAMLRAEAASGFPDLSRIREVICSAGYLPQSCRGHVWSVLLIGGSVVEDQEAEFWRPSGRDENIENYSQLRSDCEAIVKRVTDKAFVSQKPTNPFQCKDDLHDILLLYCIRKKIPYRSLLCDILSPLIFVPAPYSPPSRALSSSCFYSLSNSFIPLINLPVCVL